MKLEAIFLLTESRGQRRHCPDQMQKPAKGMTSEHVRIVVLDDDPTGIQTVHGCYLLTDWQPHTLRAALTDEQPFFYVLTNTRAYGREKAQRIINEAVTNVLAVNRELGHSLVFVSRSDSTLRNHFPAEIEVIIRKLEQQDARPVDAIFLVPAFIECGRITVGNVHYLAEGNRRIPVSETEFARDSVFGYRTSVLPDYIEEKTRGAVRATEVRSIPLEWLRAASGGASAPKPGETLDGFLHNLSDRTYVVVNAENYTDLNCFAQAALKQVAAGKRFVFQSAGSLVKALSGIPDKPLLRKEIARGTGHGLFVAGSHVQKTTAQLKRLLESGAVEGVEVAVTAILKSGKSQQRLLSGRIQTIWRNGKTPVVFTSRTELQFDSKDERLRAGETISHFLAELVRGLPECPSYLVAKGGITSHDILVNGLEVRQARVLGQILPGVPVIMTPDDSRFPRMPYVIFPGNVGGEEALLQVFQILSAGKEGAGKEECE
jgi:uncharacterized protein YgbK (DUF1537 family)